jgi:two-component system sensor histidine kinase DesK
MEWAISGVLIIILVGIMLIMLKNTKAQQLQLEKEHREKMEELHGADRLMAEKLRQTTELVGEVLKDSLQYISVSESPDAKKLTERIQQITWAVANCDDGLEALKAKISEFVEGSDPAIKVEDNTTNDLYLTPIQLLSLYEVAVEAIENAKKHAKSSEIKVSFDDHEFDIVMEIEDNGIGFELETEGRGMSFMKEKVELGGGRIIIRSTDRGSSINATIPWRFDQVAAADA